MTPQTPATGEGWTAGPWEMQPTVRDGDIPGVTIVGSNLGGLIGAALPWPTEIDSGDFARVEANAKMMAAAPSLHATLIAAKQEMWIMSRVHWNMADFKNFAAVQQIDAALTAADGKRRS